MWKIEQEIAMHVNDDAGNFNSWSFPIFPPYYNKPNQILNLSY